MALLEPSPTLPLQAACTPVLLTERLVLRPLEPNDAEAIASLINDRRIAENTARIPHPYAREDAEQFIAHVAAGNELALLVTLPDDTIVGACGIGSLRSDGPEIGYWFGVQYWGRGYATEAARALIEHAFTELNYEELRGGARVSNPASRRVLEKCGFVWTGVVLTRVRALDTSVPCDRFLLNRAQWLALRPPTMAARAAA